MIARMLFEEYDKDGGGKLDAKEVHALVHRLGKKMTNDDTKRMVAKNDKDGGGSLDVDEFTSWWIREGGKGVKIPEDIPRDAHAMGDAYFALEVGCYVELATWFFGLLLLWGRRAEEGTFAQRTFTNDDFKDVAGTGVFLSTAAYALWCFSLGARDEWEAQRAEKRAVAHILFREYDADGGGRLDFKEVKALCERLGKKMDDDQIRKMLRKVGGDDDQIDSHEFVEWCVTP